MKESSAVTNTVANRLDWSYYLRRLQGSTIRLDLSEYAATSTAIADLEAELQALTDEDIQTRACTLRDRVRAGEELGQIRSAFFALAREAARRVIGERPFDEQVVAALALDAGTVVEMQTGEGKTLAAVMPAALNALDRSRRARSDVQRLPCAPRRRVDGPDLSNARPLGRIHPARDGAERETRRLSGRHHLRHGERGGIRPSARSARDAIVRSRPPAIPLCAGRRSRFADDRRSASPARDRRQLRSRGVARAAAGRACQSHVRRAFTTTPTNMQGTSS